MRDPQPSCRLPSALFVTHQGTPAPRKGYMSITREFPLFVHVREPSDCRVTMGLSAVISSTCCGWPMATAPLACTSKPCLIMSSFPGAVAQLFHRDQGIPAIVRDSMLSIRTCLNHGDLGATSTKTRTYCGFKTVTAELLETCHPQVLGRLAVSYASRG